MVILQAVDGQGDHFNATFTELTAQSGSSTQLCGAHGGVVSRVGEQDSPSGMKRRILCQAYVKVRVCASILGRYLKFHISDLTQFPLLIHTPLCYFGYYCDIAQ